jgi:hypothetical protein
MRISALHPIVDRDNQMRLCRLFCESRKAVFVNTPDSQVQARNDGERPFS